MRQLRKDESAEFLAHAVQEHPTARIYPKTKKPTKQTPQRRMKLSKMLTRRYSDEKKPKPPAPTKRRYDKIMRLRSKADVVDVSNPEQQKHYQDIGWIDTDDAFTPFTRFLRPPANTIKLKKVASRKYFQNPANAELYILAVKAESNGEAAYSKSKQLRFKTLEKLKRLNQTYPDRATGVELLVWVPRDWYGKEQHKLFEGEQAEWLQTKCPLKCRPTRVEKRRAHVLFRTMPNSTTEQISSLEHEPWQAVAMTSVHPQVLNFSAEGIDIILNDEYYSDMPMRFPMQTPLRGHHARFAKSPRFKSQKAVTAATFVSTCEQPRLDFMHRLKEAGIVMKNYGACLPYSRKLNCSKQEDICKLDKAREHRFSFGFERMLVGQHAGAALSRMVAHTGVNVYYGSPQGVPDYGFPIIEAMDFYSEAELAKFLKKVGRNSTLFEHYSKRAFVFDDPWIDSRRSARDLAGVVCAACLAYIEKGYFFGLSDT